MVDRKGFEEKRAPRPAPSRQPESGTSREASPAKAPRTLDGVLLDELEVGGTTVLGPILLGLNAWEALDMPRLLHGLGMSETQARTAFAVVASRLVEPMSERALGEFLPHTSFPDLLGDWLTRPGSLDRLYRSGDLLLDRKKPIEAHLRRREGEVFNLDRSIILYDLTNSYFEGECLSNPKAVRSGSSKHKRGDCPQVTLGVSFDAHGFPLASETFAGNVGESTTLLEMVERLRLADEADGKLATSPLVILDGGLATEENIASIRGAGLDYLVNESRRRRQRHAELFDSDGFVPVPGRASGEEVLVKTAPGELDGETLVLCRSSGRADKERAILSGAERRLLADLGALGKSVASGKLADEELIHRKIGRALGKHTRAARFYEVKLEKIQPSGVKRLAYHRRDAQMDEADGLAGCYALRTNRPGLRPEELWRLYMRLTKAEDGFRSLKSDLKLRPNFHRTEARVDAHVFITILAYHLLRYVEHTLESAGDFRTWSTVRRVMQTHCYATLSLPTRDGGLARIRKPGAPEAAQWEIYRRFGITSMASLPRSESVAEPRDSGKGGDFVVAQKNGA
jgi:hypothetical protein